MKVIYGLLLIGFLSVAVCQGEVAVFVSPFGSDENSGTQDNPVETLPRARDMARMKHDGNSPVQIQIENGVYRLASPLELDGRDSNTSWLAANSGEVVVSGGQPLGQWKNIRDNLWKTRVPQQDGKPWVFRQLFSKDGRLQRARTPNKGYFYTTGPASKYADYKRNRADVGGLRRTNPDLFCGFSFNEGDVKEWDGWRNAEVITYHSWECSWQTIRKIDIEKHDLLFNTPCRYPIGYFSNRARYRVENVREALDEAGEWYLDAENETLFYLAKANENPNRMDIVAPVLEKMLVIEGKEGERVSNVQFTGIKFRDTRYPVGIYDVAPKWPKEAKDAGLDWPESFPPGYTDSQASPRCGSAIDLKDAENCTFLDCDMSRMGGYALLVGARSNSILVSRCSFTSLGGGGVMIGSVVRGVGEAGLKRETVPFGNTVDQCVFRDLSLIHPSAVAVWIAQSHHNKVTQNEISHTGYSGISVGWTWGRSPNFSDSNIVEGNHIHHVLEGLADGGGIYTLGILKDTRFSGNFIHDIGRPEGAIGSHNNGMFLDEGSMGILIEGNVLYRIEHLPVRFNQNKEEEHVWRNNFFFDAKSGVESMNDLPPEARKIAEQAGPKR